jgi:tetratricopeptide (TPR) repeat protein
MFLNDATRRSPRKKMVMKEVISRFSNRMGGAGPRNGSRETSQLVSDGDAARDRGDWAAAAAAYAQALVISPSNASILVQYGHALKESGALHDAEKQYRLALEVEPGNPDTELQLGHALKLQGEMSAALAAYRRAHMLDPEFEPASVEIMAMTGLPPVREAISGDNLRASHGASLSAQANPVQAFRASAGSQNEGSVHARINALFDLNGEDRLTGAAIRKACAKPGAAEVIVTSLRAMKRQVQKAAALEVANAARLMASSIKDPRQLRRIVAGLADIDDEFCLTIQTADAARDNRNWGEAEFHYWRALELFPDHAGYRVQYAHVLKEGGKFLDAEVHYRCAFSQGETGPDISSFIEYTQSKRGGQWSRDAMMFVLDFWGKPKASQPMQMPVTKFAVDAVFPLFADRAPTMEEIASSMAASGSLLDLCRNLMALPDFAACNRDLLSLIHHKNRSVQG